MSTHFADLPSRDPTRCVLLAEDDPAMRAMLARALRRWGYLVVEALDGDHLAALVDALLLAPGAGARAIDVIVSDVRMPGPSGIDVLGALRAVDWATPVVLMSAFADASVHAEAERLGAVAVFDKPFDVDDLCTAVVNVVSP